MRTFIAIRVTATPAIQTALRTLATMRPSIRAVAEDQLHVTLKFLGETGEDQIPDLLSIMERAAQSEHARPVVLRGLGAFPNTERPTVVWGGFADSGPLVPLANELSESCRALGFEPERRPFQPHLTLARVKSEPPGRLTTFLRDNRNVEYGAAMVSGMDLYRSDLKPGGPVYSVIGSVSLPH